jgi:hypothetical protein
MPYKFLAERWFEEAYRLMLYWAEESNTSIKGFSTDSEGDVQSYEILPDDIDKNGIYLSVELQQDVPIDKQQRMATAVQASEALKLPTRDILEMLGETDPERKIKQWMNEQMDMAYFQGVLQHIQFESQQAIEEMLAQAQLQMQMEQAQQLIAQQAAGAAQQGQQQGQPGSTPNPANPPGLEGVEGAGFDPNQGGQAPANAVPGTGSASQATGQTLAGEDVA